MKKLLGIPTTLLLLLAFSIVRANTQPRGAHRRTFNWRAA